MAVWLRETTCTSRRTAAFADCVTVSPSAVSSAVGKDARDLEITKQSHHRGLKNVVRYKFIRPDMASHNLHK